MSDRRNEAQVTGTAPQPIRLSAFLESIPPSQPATIADIAEAAPKRFVPDDYVIRTPDVQLPCEQKACGGVRYFRYVGELNQPITEDSFSNFFLEYRCSNCQETIKTFSLAARKAASSMSGECRKFGEWPTFGAPTPARLIKLVEPDRELFLKGRRCENQGLGIGAFVYYRRVVESQKGRILGEIIKVSQKLNVSAETIAILQAAQKESQFKRAMESVKDAIPESLLIRGHNPMLLLHSALSDGLHDQTDEHCLEIASSIRVVLAELSERLSQALKDETELNTALARLMTKKGG